MIDSKYRDIEVFYDYDIYLPTGTIYLGSINDDPDYGSEVEAGIDYAVASRFIKGLHLLEDTTFDNIDIILNNPGGDINHMFALYDAIKTFPKHTTIKCFGQVMSAASVIFQAGNKRLMAPNCYMMIHDGDWTYSGNTKDYENWATVSKDVRKRMYNIYYERMLAKDSSISLRRIEYMCNHDKILTANEAVNLGLADSIIKPYGEESSNEEETE